MFIPTFVFSLNKKKSSRQKKQKTVIIRRETIRVKNTKEKEYEYSFFCTQFYRQKIKSKNKVDYSLFSLLLNNF